MKDKLIHHYSKQSTKLTKEQDFKFLNKNDNIYNEKRKEKCKFNVYDVVTIKRIQEGQGLKKFRKFVNIREYQC